MALRSRNMQSTILHNPDMKIRFKYGSTQLLVIKYASMLWKSIFFLITPFIPRRRRKTKQVWSLCQLWKIKLHKREFLHLLIFFFLRWLAYEEGSLLHTFLFLDALFTTNNLAGQQVFFSTEAFHRRRLRKPGRDRRTETLKGLLRRMHP